MMFEVLGMLNIRLLLVLILDTFVPANIGFYLLAVVAAYNVSVNDEALEALRNIEEQFVRS
ncbi:MAG: hypothetical protein ACOC5A_06985 [Halanaerobiales bacterium]